MAGRKNGQEQVIAERYGLEFEPVRVVRKPSRKLSAETLLFGVELMAVAADGITMVGKVDPDVVVGFGGYGSFPSVVGGALRGRPVFIHEQNSVAGQANRMLSRFARKVFISDEQTAREFGTKAVYTGNPSRFDGIKRIDKKEAREKLGLDQERTTIFVFGGSQGAQSINKAAYDFAGINSSRNKIQLLHIVGENNYEAAKKNYEEIVTNGNTLKVDVRDYLHEMFEAYCAADLVVCRAGATTIAEITSIGAPAILVPYPYATADHQLHNARSLEKQGAASVIVDSELNGETLNKKIFELLDSPEKLDNMAARAAGQYSTGVAARMAEHIIPFLD